MILFITICGSRQREVRTSHSLQASATRDSTKELSIFSLRCLKIYLESLTGAAAVPAEEYFVLPNEKGTYLYLIMCLICFFMVMKNNTMK